MRSIRTLSCFVFCFTAALFFSRTGGGGDIAERARGLNLLRVMEQAERVAREAQVGFSIFGESQRQMLLEVFVHVNVVRCDNDSSSGGLDANILGRVSVLAACVYCDPRDDLARISFLPFS